MFRRTNLRISQLGFGVSSMSWRSRIGAYIRYNLLVMPIIFVIYVPYNVFFIGYTPVQLLKWALTAGFVSALANVVLQPWITWIHKKGFVK